MKSRILLSVVVAVVGMLAASCGSALPGEAAAQAYLGSVNDDLLTPHVEDFLDTCFTP